jgi:hypothetical protein
VSQVATTPDQVLFSGGTGRSGTTIIGKLLGKHQAIRASKPLEIKFLAAHAGLLDLTFGRRDFIEMKKQKSIAYRMLMHSKTFSRRELERKFRERLQADWWERGSIPGKGSGLSSGVSVEVRDAALAQFMHDRRKDPEGAALRFFETMITAQVNNNGESIWIDTSPPNIFNADRIVRLLPDARFIHMKRDGRNTIASVLKEHWGPSEPLRAIHWWKNRMIASHKALQSLPSNSYVEIQLEEIAHYDRENQYQRLLSFLRVDDDPAMRQYFEDEFDGHRVIAQKWRAEILEPKFERKFAKVHKELSELGVDSPLYD